MEKYALCSWEITQIYSQVSTGKQTEKGIDSLENSPVYVKESWTVGK
jgi:hypothetical protein